MPCFGGRVPSACPRIYLRVPARAPRFRHTAKQTEPDRDRQSQLDRQRERQRERYRYRDRDKHRDRQAVL